MSRSPLILTLLVILSFGLLIPWLGFGGDEWNFVYYATRGLPGIREVFHYDGHIQSIWIYFLSFRLLGYSPLAWHLYALLWRLVAVLTFWLTLRCLWPEYSRRIFIVSAFFAIYPILQIQITPIGFFEIWLNYTFLFASFYFTLRALRDPNKFYLYTALAILLKFGHAFTSEYTWFLELMRPVLIWLVLPAGQSAKTKLRQTLLIWSPYLLIFSISTIWRGFFYTPLRKAFYVQTGLFAHPLQTLLAWGLNLVPDLLIILFTSWYSIFSANFFDLTRPLNLALLVLTGLIAAGLFFVLNTNQEQSDKPASSPGLSWHWQATLLSIPSLLFGILPFYVAGYTLYQTNNDRLAVAVIPGAALLLTVLLEKIFASPHTRNIFLALLIGLSATWHLRYTNEFRKTWLYQRDFFQQLLWRAPGIQPETILYTLHPNLPLDQDKTTEFMFHDFRMALAVNAFYQPNPQETNSKVSYWYQSNLPLPDQFNASAPYLAESYTASFAGNAHDALVILYDPQSGACLHIVRPIDADYAAYPDALRVLAPFTATQRITSTLQQNQIVRSQVLGNQPARDWCYYYQTADLAAQFEQWDTIPNLWQQASASSLHPSNGLEYIPFIQAYAHQDDWQTAFTLTKTAFKVSKGMASPLCSIWRQLDQAIPTSAQKTSALSQTRQLLGCNP